MSTDIVNSGRLNNSQGFERAMSSEAKYYIDNLNAQRFDQGEGLLAQHEVEKIKNNFFEQASKDEINPDDIHSQGFLISQTLSPEATQWLDDMRQVEYNLSYADTIAGMSDEFEEGAHADILSLLDGSQNLLNGHYGTQEDGSPNMSIEEFAEKWDDEYSLSISQMKEIGQNGTEAAKDNSEHSLLNPDDPQAENTSSMHTAFTA